MLEKFIFVSSDRPFNNVIKSKPTPYFLKGNVDEVIWKLENIAGFSKS